MPPIDRPGMLEAETRFRKVQGYRGLATLAVKIETDLMQRVAVVLAMGTWSG